MEHLQNISQNKGLIHKLYKWVISFSQTPYSILALFIVAFVESSFFPVPPDVLLIALCVSVPAKSFKFALICSIGSVLGGVFGYFIGFHFYELVGKKIIEFYNLQHYFSIVGEKYRENAFVAISIAGFTPIPYKVFTIAAGVFHEKVGLHTLVFASLLSRSARFFLVGGLIYIFGPKIQDFIEKYLNLLTIIFVVLLFLGFFAIKFLR